MREPVVRSEGFWADFLNGFFLRPVYRCTPVRSARAEDPPQESTPASLQGSERMTESQAAEERRARNPVKSSSSVHMDRIPIDSFIVGFPEHSAQLILPEFPEGLSVTLDAARTHADSLMQARLWFNEALTQVERTQNPDSAVLYLMVKDAEGHLVAIDPRNAEHADLLKEAIREIGEHPASAMRLEPPTDLR